MIKEGKLRLTYVLVDYLMVNIVWCLFNLLRFNMIDSNAQGFRDFWAFVTSHYVVLGQILFPLMMLGIFYLSGYYLQVFFRSRFDELVNTMGCALTGTIIIYFVALINDDIPDRLTNYELLAILWGLMFGIVYVGRAIITNRVSRNIKSRRWGFDTLIVGTSTAAVEIEERMRKLKKGMGFNIVGFVDPAPGTFTARTFDLPVYSINDLKKVIEEHKIRNLIVTSHRHGMKATVEMLNQLYRLDMPIYISPNLYHLITASTRISNIVGEPLIDVSRAVISPMTVVCKRVSDVVVSALTLLLLLPLFMVLAIIIKLDSKGPVFYKQSRLGFHKRPFNIYKFRTMKVDAEDGGPALSSVNDPRVTKVGRFLRKYRIDELPQFWNVVKGDMSIVGPRPERAYYFDQIVKRAPYAALVHQVRPGITSWAMVKHGYASNVDAMIERVPFDLLYIENISFSVDLKILIHTFNTVFRGKGL